MENKASIIYYTDNRLDEELDSNNPDSILPHLVRESLLKARLPIISCSLKPMSFGVNIVLNREPGVMSYYHQIFTALQNVKTKYVFFCEHDVIYHKSHFDFIPPRDDTFYYNTNVFRCHPRRNKAITYDHMRSVSGICVNTELAIEHYDARIKYIYEQGFDKLVSKNPKWARVMGYEPGKNTSNGGFRNTDKIAEWKSEFPNVDIRHRRTLTVPKMDKEQFAVKPINWKECTADDIPGWDIRKMFNLK